MNVSFRALHRNENAGQASVSWNRIKNKELISCTKALHLADRIFEGLEAINEAEVDSSKLL
jgi:hypothetical protein